MLLHRQNASTENEITFYCVPWLIRVPKTQNYNLDDSLKLCQEKMRSQI